LSAARPLLVIGAGGFGRTVAGLVRAHAQHGRAFAFAGFLDSRRELDGRPYAVLGDPLTHIARPDELFLCALGEPAQRRRYAAPLLAQGAEFAFLDAGADLGERVDCGAGVILELRAYIGPDCRLAEFVTILSGAIIGHDVAIGAYAQIGALAFVGGGARIGAGAVVHTHATVLPGVRVGAGAVVGAGSVVMGDVPDGATVIGNPARRFEFK
jgi:sugar O-acyltransferase (sialic acid O-acetyltransferase NeuD family)